jgi:hypothetical protein
VEDVDSDQVLQGIAWVWRGFVGEETGLGDGNVEVKKAFV